MIAGDYSSDILIQRCTGHLAVQSNSDTPSFKMSWVSYFGIANKKLLSPLVSFFYYLRQHLTDCLKELI